MSTRPTYYLSASTPVWRISPAVLSVATGPKLTNWYLHGWRAMILHNQIGENLQQ